MQDKDCDPDRPFFNMLLGGGETLPCPIISEDFSTIVAALDRTSKGFSEGSALYVVDACTEIIESGSAAVVPRITDIPHEKVELFKAEVAKAVLQMLSTARISSSV